VQIPNVRQFRKATVSEKRATDSKSDSFGKVGILRKATVSEKRATVSMSSLRPSVRAPPRAQVGLQGLALPITLSLEDLDALTEDKVRGGLRLRVPVLHASLQTGSTQSVKLNQHSCPHKLSYLAEDKVRGGHRRSTAMDFAIAHSAIAHR
jgi:hypothetical protein